MASAGDRDALGLAAGELPRPATGQLPDPEPVEPAAGGVLRLAASDPPGARPEGNVGEGSEVGEEQLLLEDQADPAVLRRSGQQWLAVERRGALGRDQAGERLDQAGLAGAVGADHGQHLTRLEAEGGLDPAGDGEVDGEPAHVPSHRSRRSSSTATETTSITRLSASAASWSDWRVT